jgi:hypothetical protein
MKVLHEVLKGSESFKWIPSQTPLASDRSVVISCASYLAVIGFLSYVIRSPIQLPRFIPACHNVILCLGSLIMFVGTGWEVYKVSTARDEKLVCVRSVQGTVHMWTCMHMV